MVFVIIAQLLYRPITTLKSKQMINILLFHTMNEGSKEATS